MLYKLLEFLRLCIPLGLVLNFYKSKKALPTNIKTKTGKLLKAVMITNTYGLLFMEKTYVEARIKVLREKQLQVNKINEDIAKELNSMSSNARELFFEVKNENNNI